MQIITKANVIWNSFLPIFAVITNKSPLKRGLYSIASQSGRIFMDPRLFRSGKSITQNELTTWFEMRISNKLMLCDFVAIMISGPRYTVLLLWCCLALFALVADSSKAFILFLPSFSSHWWGSHCFITWLLLLLSIFLEPDRIDYIASLGCWVTHSVTKNPFDCLSRSLKFKWRIKFLLTEFDLRLSFRLYLH